MDKSNLPPDHQEERESTSYTDIYLQGLLVLVLCIAGLFQWIGWNEIPTTIYGMLIAALGGMLIGVIAYRYLGNNKNNTEIILGMGIVIALGVLAMGYLYIFHIKGPMDSIGTSNRAIKQTIIFLEFLIAHVSGIKLGQRYLQNDSE